MSGLTVEKIRPIKEAVRLANELFSYEENWKSYVNFVNYNFSDHHDRKFGHAFMKHCGVSEHDLKTRVLREKKYGASAFTIPAEKVASIIHDNLLDRSIADEIMVWLFSSPGIFYNLFLYMDEDIGIGYLRNSAHDWEQGPIKCDSICVTLAADYDDPTRFTIITAYPYLEGLLEY
jgi:hypothetical protein